MARVIKGGGAAGPQKPQRAPTRMIVDGAKKVIERELVQARREADEVMANARAAREQIYADARRAASQAREEAAARGASEAFAQAAAEALTAFRRRAERYGEAADDIRVLAIEVAKKVLGSEPDLGTVEVERILKKGLAQLRARRRLRVQVAPRRLKQLAAERPNLMRVLGDEPDLVVEAADDVGFGFARVVTEVGGALCAEETALDALSLAVGVREQPRQGRSEVGGKTSPGTPGTLASTSVPGRVDPTSLPDAHWSEHASEISKTGAPVPVGSDDDGEETQQFVGRPRGSDSREARRVATGRVEATNRAATRVVPIGKAPGRVIDPDGTQTLDVKNLRRELSEKETDGDDDLDLFTDEAVPQPPQRRR